MTLITSPAHIDIKKLMGHRPMSTKEITPEQEYNLFVSQQPEHMKKVIDNLEISALKVRAEEIKREELISSLVSDLEETFKLDHDFVLCVKLTNSKTFVSLHTKDDIPNRNVLEYYVKNSNHAIYNLGTYSFIVLLNNIQGPAFDLFYSNTAGITETEQVDVSALDEVVHPFEAPPGEQVEYFETQAETTEEVLPVVENESRAFQKDLND